MAYASILLDTYMLFLITDLSGIVYRYYLSTLHLPVLRIGAICSKFLHLAPLAIDSPAHRPLLSIHPSDVRPSIHNFLVNTPASTNMNQSAPNLVILYMTIRSRMSGIMELIGPELSELSALELENLPYLTLLTLYHLQILTNQYQTWP